MTTNNWIHTLQKPHRDGCYERHCRAGSVARARIITGQWNSASAARAVIDATSSWKEVSTARLPCHIQWVIQVRRWKGRAWGWRYYGDRLRAEIIWTVCRTWPVRSCSADQWYCQSREGVKARYKRSGNKSIALSLTVAPIIYARLPFCRLSAVAACFGRSNFSSGRTWLTCTVVGRRNGWMSIVREENTDWNDDYTLHSRQ